MNPTNSLSVNSSERLPQFEIYENPDFGKVRTITINNEPYFVGKDVAIALGYAKSQNAIAEHVDEDDTLKQGITDSLGRIQDTTIINESGVYSLVFGSKLPKAKEFKRWVTSVVLPSIRKNGGYINNQENLSESELMAKALLVAHKTLEDCQKKVAIMQPKADVYDQLVDRSKCINFRDFASKIGFSQSEFMTILKSKYIYKNSIGEYRAYSEYQKYFTLRTFNKSADKTGEQLMLNMDGITYFTEKYKPGAVAESFIEKGESEYQKIINKTSMNYLDKAMQNHPESNNTFIDKIKTYTFKQVARLAGDDEETIKNFCKAERWIDENCKPYEFSNDGNLYITEQGRLTEKAKNEIVAIFSTVRDYSKKMKPFTCGKGE